MKKLIFLIITIAVVIIMVACNHDTPSTDNGVDIPTDTVVTTTTVAPKLPEFSGAFIKTALQFIDESPTPSKELENLAAEVINQSGSYRQDLYSYLNYHLSENYGEEIHQFFGYGYEEVSNVEVFIHNYQNGGDVGAVSFNGHEATYNYEHDNIILSAGVVGEKYPDNLSLAEARIASYVLTQMSPEQVDCCIVTSPDGLKSYDFTFGNKSFKETAREILLDLLED